MGFGLEGTGIHLPFFSDPGLHLATRIWVYFNGVMWRWLRALFLLSARLPDGSCGYGPYLPGTCNAIYSQKGHQRRIFLRNKLSPRPILGDLKVQVFSLKLAHIHALLWLYSPPYFDDPLEPPHKFSCLWFLKVTGTGAEVYLLVLNILHLCKDSKDFPH